MGPQTRNNTLDYLYLTPKVNRRILKNTRAGVASGRGAELLVSPRRDRE